jgi:hypothetical protein
MESEMKRVLSIVAATLLLIFLPVRAADGSFSHADWTETLQKFVDDHGLVDYQGLSGDRTRFDQYLGTIKTISPDSDPDLFPTTEDALAYFLNAYNAQVFQGVLERGPELESVWSGLISGYSFFVGMSIVIGGETTNLKTLEDDTIRKRFGDARVHAALNCASIACPRLPRLAFESDRLDEQLDAAMREFVADPRHCRVDSGLRTVTLSKIFDWYRADFLADERGFGNPDPRLVDYLNRFRSPTDRIPRDFRVRFFDYDKRINSQ